MSARNERAALRFLTCGAVDDGKSTLLGRLLYEGRLIAEDALEEVRRHQRRSGASDPDVAMLLDGLEAEREQSITIDVGYRFFATEKRKFVAADTPGHEQYTRNMATAASNADLAIVLIDVQKGLQLQTRRHAHMLALLGVPHLVLAVNKMDLVDYDKAAFDRVVDDFKRMAADLPFAGVTAIPLSARFGVNVAVKARETPWFDGPHLLQALEEADVSAESATKPFRFPVQWVNRPSPHFRGYSGVVVAGRARVGDPVVAARSGLTSHVMRILAGDQDVDEAGPEEAITLVLADEIDVSRGELLASTTARPTVADQFSAHVIWMSERALEAGRPYLMKCGPLTTLASVTAVVHRVDVQSFASHPARTLEKNDIGLCTVQCHAAFAFDPYAENRDTGAFLLIDRISHETVCAGMIQSPGRAMFFDGQRPEMTSAERSASKGHPPAVIWFTGLSGAGKSSIANAVERRLADLGHHTYALDGDVLRRGLSQNLGFTAADRIENVRRAAEVARLMAEAGLIVTCAFISPHRSDRQMARDLIGSNRFLEVFVDAPLAVCERRDPKGLYAKARAGLIKDFTGLDSPYERPISPDLTIESDRLSIDAARNLVIAALVEKRMI